MALLPRDLGLVQSLFNTLEENWQDTNFDVTEFCRHCHQQIPTIQGDNSAVGCAAESAVERIQVG